MMITETTSALTMFVPNSPSMPLLTMRPSWIEKYIAPHTEPARTTGLNGARWDAESVIVTMHIDTTVNATLSMAYSTV